MFARALIVLLLVLNAGVAAWWIARAPPATVPAPRLLPGVAELHLVGETPAVATSTTIPGMAAVTAADMSAAGLATATAPIVAAQCFTLGPFNTAQAVQAAQARLPPLIRAAFVRETRRGGGRGWRALVAPLSSAKQANALAQRIADAGFDDYFVMRQGSQANAIALGRYGNQATAQRRADTLVAAGFAAIAEPLGGSAFWLDVSAAPGPGQSVAIAQRLPALPQPQPLDCTAMQGSSTRPR